MKKIMIPDWLKKILDDSGLEQGKYFFDEESVELENLPDGFVGVAECENGGLAVAKKNDGVIYRLENGGVDVYAVDEKEFLLAIHRDEAWEELSENMPARRSFWLGVVVKMRSEAGEELALGFKGSSRDSVMVIQAEIKAEEMLQDALNRELKTSLMITNFEIMDVLDEGGVFEGKGVVVPMFTVVVEVEGFDPTTIGDPKVGWISLSKRELTN